MVKETKKRKSDDVCGGRNSKRKINCTQLSNSNQTQDDNNNSDDDDENITIPPSQSQRKRTNNAAAGPSRQRTTNQDDNNNSDDDENIAIPPSQSQRKRTNNSEAGPSRKRTTKNNENVTISNTIQLEDLLNNNGKRSGKIKKITLRNFMCHSNLSVDLNQRTNLLVGNNGSGKSAILTALIVGLGSRSTATSRCSNLKQLIKRGENSATIEIQLQNYEHDGLDIEKFGETITVIRSLTLSGGSSYKIKNSSGHIVTQSRAELLKILLFLNIQVDNPVCVLNQDASRSFLRESDPKKQFQLFLKATQLETIMETLNDCHAPYEAGISNLKYQTKLTAVKKTLVDETQETFNRLLSVNTLKEKIINLKLQQSWLLVESQEKLVNDMQITKNEYEKKFNELKDSCSASSVEEKLKQCIEEFFTQKQQLDNDIKYDTEQREDLKGKYKQKLEIQQNFTRNIKTLEAKQQRFLNDIKQLEQDIAERTDGFMGRINADIENNKLKISQFKEHKQELLDMLENTKRDLKMLTNSQNQWEIKFKEYTDLRMNIIAKAENLNRQIQQCDLSAKDSMLAYGNYMPKLIADIEALHRRGTFTKKPLGPLGRYIEVQDEKWKGSIEGILGAIIQSFCVDNAKDLRILTEFIKKNYPNHMRFPIISTKFIDHVYDVRRGIVNSVNNTFVAMNLIRVTEPVVMNCLIDQCQIETILLCEDEQLAMNLTAEEENVPKNLSRLVLKKPNTDFYPAPKYRSYSNGERYAKYLQVNMAQTKRIFEEELIKSKNEKTDLETKLRSYQTRLLDLSKTLQEKNKSFFKLETELGSVSQEIQEMEAIEYPTENETITLQNELIELKQSLAQTQLNLNEQILKTDEIGNMVVDAEKQLLIVKERIGKKETEICSLENKLERQKRKLDENLAKASQRTTQTKQMEIGLEKLKKEFIDAVTKQKRLEDVAKKQGPRVEVIITEDEILRKISISEKKISSISNLMESIDEVTRLLEHRTKDYNYHKNIIENLHNLLKSLRRSQKQRYQMLASLKQHMSLRVQHMFNSLLKLRNYSGDIKIDHTNETLTLKVIPRDKEMSNAVSNTKSLSGGERSFSTVALLLSLWSCIDYPFYFLDEYDVFADPVNRYYLTKLLIGEATNKPNRQYVFLTPQDMSDFNGTDTLTIHRLADPEKNNP